MTSQGSAADANAKKKVTRKKAAKKTATPKKAAKRKSVTKNTATRKRAAKKKAPKKKTTNKRTVARKTAARKRTADKPAAHSLTPQAQGGGIEQRVDERHEVPGLLEVEVELFGYQRDGREFGIGPTPDTARKIHSFGHTLNLSISGMLAEVDDMVTDGSHCLVHFVNAGAGVRPELRWGLVVRCVELESGKCEVAVRFDSPLEHLDVTALAAA